PTCRSILVARSGWVWVCGSPYPRLSRSRARCSRPGSRSICSALKPRIAPEPSLGGHTSPCSSFSTFRDPGLRRRAKTRWRSWESSRWRSWVPGLIGSTGIACPRADRSPASRAVKGAARHPRYVTAWANGDRLLRGWAGDGCEVVAVTRVDEARRYEQVERIEGTCAPRPLGPVSSRTACVLERVAPAGCGIDDD